MSSKLWDLVLDDLETQVDQIDFNMCLMPLQLSEKNNAITLFAPNEFISQNIKDSFLDIIKSSINKHSNDKNYDNINVTVGSLKQEVPFSSDIATVASAIKETTKPSVTLNPNYTFERFVQGNSNSIAEAACKQVGMQPGNEYNPLFIYGGVGLGKTHLMHSAGHLMRKRHPDIKIQYIHSEKFVSDMVKALQRNQMHTFKENFLQLDALLIDDIQFLKGKERSQHEFFLAINSLLERQAQIIVTSDRYPKELEGIEDRLISRFGWGLSVGIDPPELETRVAILMNKAQYSGVELDQEIAFFIAKHVRSNVRELEGALKRVIANAHFTGERITLDFAAEALKDLVQIQAKLVTLDNIQRITAKYYNIKINDLIGKKDKDPSLDLDKWLCILQNYLHLTVILR